MVLQEHLNWRCKTSKGQLACIGDSLGREMLEGATTPQNLYTEIVSTGGCVQNPPEWAWDVLAKWKVEAPGVVEDLKADEKYPFIMIIYMANSEHPVALRRQLWATFSIGTKVQGCMRSIPLLGNSRPKDDVTEFEKACRLGKNIWPGDSASAKDLSFQKWGLRSRAKHASEKSFRMSDSRLSAFNLERNEDGTLKNSGGLVPPLDRGQSPEWRVARWY